MKIPAAVTVAGALIDLSLYHFKIEMSIGKIKQKLKNKIEMK